MTPEGFAKVFAGAFGRGDASGMAAMLVPDADVLTLTGAIVEGAEAAQACFAAEFEGIFAASRLVTGRVRLRDLGPGRAVVMQRFVVSGARDAAGAELPRFGAVLTAVLVEAPQGWRAVSLLFSGTA